MKRVGQLLCKAAWRTCKVGNSNSSNNSNNYNSSNNNHIDKAIKNISKYIFPCDSANYALECWRRKCLAEKPTTSWQRRPGVGLPLLCSSPNPCSALSPISAAFNIYFWFAPNRLSDRQTADSWAVSTSPPPPSFGIVWANFWRGMQVMSCNCECNCNASIISISVRSHRSACQSSSATIAQASSSDPQSQPQR